MFNKRFLQSRKLKRTTSAHRPLADHPDLADPGIQALDGGRQENEQRTLVDHYVFMIGRGGQSAGQTYCDISDPLSLIFWYLILMNKGLEWSCALVQCVEKMGEEEA